VYLMGVSHSQAETNRIIEIARTISNVQQVVSYIRLIEEIENAQNAVSTAPQPQSQGYDSAPTNTAVSSPISTGAPQPLTGASVPAVEVYPLQ